MIEAEREKMLWEKKCQLEKEAQNTLDPTVGAAESMAMKYVFFKCRYSYKFCPKSFVFYKFRNVLYEHRREIHRMEVRHSQIHRRQDQLLREMTRAIQKRDVIMAKLDTKFQNKIENWKKNEKIC